MGGTNWTTAYEHTDALRSPVHETDANANPTTRGTQWFTPFGEPGNGSYLQGPGYTGHISDAASHLTYAQQRYYDPVLGRFLSPDPVQADDKGGDFNRYWYAGNNPYKFTDPDGRAFFVDDGIGIGVGAALGIGKEEFVDLVFKRRLPTYGEFWGSAVSGGIDGEAVVNAPESMGGTLVFAAGAGAAGSSVRQLIDGGHVSASETVKDSVLSAATAGVGRKLIPETGINEWTKGRGNFASMYKGLLTKMERGQIKTMSTKSALKGVAGRQAADLYKSAAGSAVDALKSIFSSSDRAVDQQEHCNGSCTSGGGVTITP
ncbi:MAG: RHS repeat-associated core domain-containing protein [Proteobacteria bacterium]|nr:RHS repeat-associated core domain-containing protein [Pseudomonadota bacterium]